MPKAKVDFRQFTSLLTKFQRLAHKDKSEFSTDIVKDLAARLLRKVKKRTPVNKKATFDKTYTGGGTLRRGWTIGNVVKTGDTYNVEVINPVKYASYVEKGHRGVAIYVKKGGTDIGWRVMHKDTHWTSGVFMLEISEKELGKDAERIVEKKLEKLLKKLRR